MMKKLWPCARPSGLWILAGVACSAAEAVFELLIPLVMSDIVNVGIPAAECITDIKLFHSHSPPFAISFYN